MYGRRDARGGHRRAPLGSRSRLQPARRDSRRSRRRGRPRDPAQVPRPALVALPPRRPDSYGWGGCSTGDQAVQGRALGRSRPPKSRPARRRLPIGRHGQKKTLLPLGLLARQPQKMNGAPRSGSSKFAPSGTGDGRAVRATLQLMSRFSERPGPMAEDLFVQTACCNTVTQSSRPEPARPGAVAAREGRP
jgi:hypothetical protein